jgi:hypothetical protein
MKGEGQIIATAHIASRIFALRGEKVLLDADLAQIYGVPTKALNRAVKRNKDRFPEDFLFQLTDDEIMRCQIGTASRRREIGFHVKYDEPAKAKRRNPGKLQPQINFQRSRSCFPRRAESFS